MNLEAIEAGAKAYLGDRWEKASIREQVEARRIAKRILEAASTDVGLDPELEAELSNIVSPY